MKTKILALCLMLTFVAVILTPPTNSAPPLGSGSTSGLTEEEVALLGLLDTANAMEELEIISARARCCFASASDH